MKANFNARGRSMVWTLALVALPVLMGAKGKGCVAGGEITVGNNAPPDAGVACESADCGAAPDIAISACPEGTTAQSQCTESGFGTCAWAVSCLAPTNPPPTLLTCYEDECEGQARPTNPPTCSSTFRVTESYCAQRSADGPCHWEYSSCLAPPDNAGDPQECDKGGTLLIGCLYGELGESCVTDNTGSHYWSPQCAPAPVTPRDGGACGPTGCQDQRTPDAQADHPTTPSPTLLTCYEDECEGQVRPTNPPTCSSTFRVTESYCAKRSAEGPCHWEYSSCLTPPDNAGDPRECDQGGSLTLECGYGLLGEFCASHGSSSYWWPQCAPTPVTPRNGGTCSPENCGAPPLEPIICPEEMRVDDNCALGSDGLCSWQPRCVPAN